MECFDGKPIYRIKLILATKNVMSRFSLIPMSTFWPVANLAGILGILQTGTNTCLCKEYFPNHVAACGVSFAIGLLTMIFICLVDEAKLPQMSDIKRCPWYFFIGGVLGGELVR